ncbi:MAG: nicotinate-nucleotide adenylyltransferase [Culturomica sp.]|jgi:nicotinate-nucleotide adenylyltransferase|nr:nicotinate-nucleotide adenylyltransferase [Culturomica sp.]
MTGLFFGSFNPIHNGHLQIARYLLDENRCKEVWFIVSPQNPFKQDAALADAQKRLEMVQAAVAGDPRMRVSDVEFGMPRPSYTIHTLEALATRYPDTKFALIMGSDNLRNFHRWRHAGDIAAAYPIFVYPRTGSDTEMAAYRTKYPNIRPIPAPLFPVSSTGIREKVRRGEDISGLVPPAALPLIVKEYAHV